MVKSIQPRNSWLKSGSANFQKRRIIIQIQTYLAGTLAVLLPLACLGIFFFYPVLSLLKLGIAPTGSLSWQAWVSTWDNPRVWRVITQTCWQGLAGASGSIILGIPGAFVFYRCQFPGRTVLRALLLIPFVLPSVVVGAALQNLFRAGSLLGFLGLERGFIPLLIGCVLFNYPLAVHTIGSLWETLDHRQVQAAQTLNARPIRGFFTITLPQLKPAIWASFAIIFLYCASAYGLVQILGGTSYGTLETEIWYQTAQLLNLPVAAVLSILQIILATSCLLIANFWQRRAQHHPRLSTPSANPLASLKQHPLTSLFTLLTCLILFLLPFGSLFWRSLQVRVSPSSNYYQFSLDNYRALFSPEKLIGLRASLGQCLLNSLTTAILAASLAIILALAVSVIIGPRHYMSTRRFSGFSGRLPSHFGYTLYELLLTLPLGVSAVTVGFGMLISLDHPPIDLRNSPLLVPIAQALVALPVVIRMLLPICRGISPRQRQAAHTLGASPIRTILTIDGPYLLRALAMAYAIALAISLGEFGATSFLSRPGGHTLPVAIYRLLSRPGSQYYGAALAACTLLALLTASCILFSSLLRRPSTSISTKVGL